MTKDADRSKDAEFDNWESTTGWDSAKWNFQGFSKMKRDFQGLEVYVNNTRDPSPTGFETSVRCEATAA